MIYIKEYKDFLLELKTILSDRSATGKTKSFDLIYDEPENPKSLSSSILLRNKLRDDEFKSISDMLGDNIPKYKVDEFIKKSKTSKKYDKLLVTLSNLKFLKSRQREGELRCEYCNKGPLTIYDINIDPNHLDNPNYKLTRFKEEDGATCDHKQPQSKGGDKFDYSNLAVCCHRCNRMKGSMSYKDWLWKLKSNQI